MITINLTQYLIKIYGDNIDNIINEDLINILDTKQYPREILEELETNQEIKNIEIFTVDGETLLLNSQKEIE
jgi:hypothetical protein